MICGSENRALSPGGKEGLIRLDGTRWIKDKKIPHSEIALDYTPGLELVCLSSLSLLCRGHHTDLRKMN